MRSTTRTHNEKHSTESTDAGPRQLLLASIFAAARGCRCGPCCPSPEPTHRTFLTFCSVRVQHTCRFVSQKRHSQNGVFLRNAPSVTNSWCSAATYPNFARFLGPKTGLCMLALAVPSHGTAAVPPAAQVPGPARGRGLSMRSARKNMNRKMACCVQTGGCFKMLHWKEKQASMMQLLWHCHIRMTPSSGGSPPASERRQLLFPANSLRITQEAMHVCMPASTPARGYRTLHPCALAQLTTCKLKLLRGRVRMPVARAVTLAL